MGITYLFGEEVSIHDVVEHQQQETERALEDLPAEAILARPLEELIPEVVDRFRLDVPVLQRATTAQLPNEEIDIDVSGDPMRGIFDRKEDLFTFLEELRFIRGPYLRLRRDCDLFVDG